MSAISDFSRFNKVTSSEEIQPLTPCEKFTSFSMSMCKELRYRTVSRGYEFSGRYEKYQHIDDPQPAHQGLFVLIHGLRSDPAAWFKQIALLEKRQNILKAHIFAPVVHNRGLCPLEEAVQPILEELKKYVQQYEERPICLLGTSNGARITLWLEEKLREISPRTPIRISNIAGVHLGSERMEMLGRFKFLESMYPKKLQEELQYKSETATQLVEKSNAPTSDNTLRSYEFFATVNDLLIPNIDSSLPSMDNHHADYYLLEGESHGSVVAAVAEEQISSCTDWMNEVSAK